MAALAVIGNISHDTTTYPDGRRHDLLGGAALHTSLAAARAGLPAAPVSMIGTDLAWIKQDPRLSALDLSCVAVHDTAASYTFQLSYDDTGHPVNVESAYGAAESLTTHALDQIGFHDAYHVCARRPLDSARVLAMLAETNSPFSVDLYSASAVEMIAAIAPHLPHAKFVFTNSTEYTALSDAVDPGTLPAIVITDGPRPARLLRYGREVAAVSPPKVTAVEVTGAGDTVAGTLLACQTAGTGDLASLQQAITAATAKIGNLDLPITPDMKEA